MIRYRLDLAYEGTAFAGWARQPNLRTAQGVLEDALATVLRRSEPVPVVVAGRTDSGVHATGQVVHVDLTEAEHAALLKKSPRDTQDEHPLARRLNGVLGAESDLVIHRAQLAPAGFDARFSAIWRRYEYRVADRNAPRDPLRRRFTLQFPRPLDLEAMQAASRELLGLNDFAAYCKPREGATTIRTLQAFDWRRDADGVLVAFVQADAFCHSMVRALAGAAIAAGAGRIAVQRPGELLREQQRSSEFAVVPAHGLTLIQVGYPADDELAARAEATRARRQATELD